MYQNVNLKKKVRYIHKNENKLHEGGITVFLGRNKIRRKNAVAMTLI